MNHTRTKILILILIIITGGFLRFYNLMFDSPYFFNPDERNMAGAVTRFTLPTKISAIPSCLISEFFYNRSITNDQRLTTNCTLNPHFFAYGQFPLYLAFASDQVSKPFTQLIYSKFSIRDQQLTAKDQQLTTNFPSAIFWLRFYSAFSSALTIVIVFLIARQFLTFNFSLLTATFTAFTPALIQAAHFGTTESLLTFFFMASIYISIKFLKDTSYSSSARGWSTSGGKFIFLTSLVIGLALGSKLTGLFFYFPPYFTLMIRVKESIYKRLKFRKKIKLLLGYWIIGLFVFIGSIIFFIFSSPYNLVDKKSFQGAVFGYEADVALGRFEAFYTRQFVDTKPIIFQAEKIFPYALGWPIFILGSLGFLLKTIQLISSLILSTLLKIKNLKLKIKKYRVKFQILHFDQSFCILHFAFLIYFIPSAFLFTKWTRFMTPILPILSIFSGYILFRFYHLFSYSSVKMENEKWKMENYKKKNNYLFLHSCILAFSIIALLPGLTFFSIYTRPDSRLQATYWIYKNIPDKSYLLFETANVVDIPLGIPEDKKINKQEYNKTYQTISFDFYHLDQNRELYQSLLEHLIKADYFFIPSRRLFKNYLKQPKKYPILTRFYQLLFSGRLGFEKVTQFNSFPSIGPLAFPDEDAEESFTVFDHPVIRIYRKIKPFTLEQYRLMFETEAISSS